MYTSRITSDDTGICKSNGAYVRFVYFLVCGRISTNLSIKLYLPNESALPRALFQATVALTDHQDCQNISEKGVSRV